MKTKNASTENSSHWPVKKRIVDPYEVSRGSSNYQRTKCVDYALWASFRRPETYKAGDERIQRGLDHLVDGETMQRGFDEVSN